MRIVQLTAENIKRLKVVSITPQGNIVQITGANAQGKSSVLDAIYYALAGSKEIPSQPIRQGEEKAFVKLNLGEIVVTRRFTPSSSTLVVEATNGARFSSPQKMLDELLGTLTFDPLAFTRFAPKEQLETLRKLVKLDVDIDAIDLANKGDFDRRTLINREVKSLESQVAALTLTLPSEVDKLAPVDEGALLAQMEASATHNSAIEKERLARANCTDNLTRVKREAEEMFAKLKQLQTFIVNEEEKIAELPPLGEFVDASAVRSQVEIARQTNAILKRKLDRDALALKLKETQAAADSLTQSMSQRLQQKEAAIAGAQMPVKGLAFGEGEVMFNGVPFAQASSAEQLCISTVLAMALNPKLKIIRIQDGSLLDDHNLELIGKLAEKSGTQVWIERLTSNDPCAIVMEDGEVVSK